ncbi:MAG: WbqC family protein, partial [Nitrospinae bacterium]|nr:WbqC family protein [Nitrospinota bacterium]
PIPPLEKGGEGGFSEEPTERLIKLCRLAGADTYLAGKDGAKYMDVEKFSKEGMKLLFQDFHHPAYNQLFGKFEPYMSVIDLLFNHGEESIEIIRNHRQIK